ncbi:MAG: alpha/beta fold hydrolase [Cyanothece sp. SIO1E1]|nr:alpha/beta fold hydrolase [Cyanothece sp. SIO1E1]
MLLVDDIAKRIANLSPEKQFLFELQLAQQKGLLEPIAIIGMGCRFPGAKNLNAFWQLLEQGIDAITEVPAERWETQRFYDTEPTAQGKLYCPWGGFLEQADQFDPEFFGISPREAAYIDPQQRLLLEVVWEALEDAGQVPSQLSGTNTGVFVGISTNDYGQLLLSEPDAIDTYTNTGVAVTMAANRISYLLNFRGPSLALDTACSSSLVGVHLACQSLWSGESTLALAGGVNLMLTPALTIGFSKLTALSPDGRCYAFDERANGFVRGEGAGMVVLKRASQALADGDPIHALIRGGAVNQDGRSNGLTAPSREAQEAVLLEAYQRTGIALSQIQYIETHGTGTLLGDPIEATALGNVLARDRHPNNPVRIGSVKTNFGHLEAAAGIAGLIKVVLCFKHRTWIPSLHFQTPNPHIPFEQLPLKVQQTCEPWPEEMGAVVAGVSSFGFGGTNSHIVLQSVPDLKPPTPDIERPRHVLTLSAKSEPALQALGQRYAALIAAQPSASLADICFSANTGRLHFAHRLAIAADSLPPLQAQLAAFATNPQSSGLAQGQVNPSHSPKIVFLFTGQGSQYIGMGQQLYETQPIFRATLNRCDQILKPYLDRPLLEILDAEILNQTAYTQPALFALEYALAELWRAWGVMPDVVMGHSVGEYVAACVAGIFSLEDGLKLIAERARLMQTLPEGGMMAAVLADEVKVMAAIAPYADQVAIAAINGPENTVISGSREAVPEILAQLKHENIVTKPLQVSHAFHSPLMEPILDEFEEIAQQIKFSAPCLPLVANLTGQLVQPKTSPESSPATSPATSLDANYWRRHMRAAVQFSASVETLYQQGYELFIEIGPNPVLAGMGRRCVPSGAGIWLPSLRQGKEDWQQLLESVGKLYVNGVTIDWSSFDRPYARRRVSLPTYPFQRQRYWPDVADRVKNYPSTPTLQPEPLPIENLNDWLYQVKWQRQPRPALALGPDLEPPRNWLIFVDQRGVGQQLVQKLTAQGDRCVLVTAGAGYQKLQADHYQVDPAAPTDLQQLLQELWVAQSFPGAGVVHLWSLDALPAEKLITADLAPAAVLGCGCVLHLLQGFVKLELDHSPRLWLVTQAAQRVNATDSSVAIAQSPLWGLGRTIAQEHPELWGGLIDLGLEATESAVSMLFEHLCLPHGEDQVAFRAGQYYVARLVRSQLPLESTKPLRLHADATYLITGGLGGLGLKIAHWMVEQGAKHLVLVSRRGTSARTQPAIQALEHAGAEVVVEPADVTQVAQLNDLLHKINRSMPPLRGLIHAAGVLDDGLLLHQDWSRFTRVLAPKVEGAWNLHTLTQGMSLDFFVLFSSAASLLGAPGQGNYTAANMFLDALAGYRQAQGLPVISINWGPWSEIGLAAQADVNQRLLMRGVDPLSWKQGVQALAQLLPQAAAQVAVLPVQWPTLLKQLPTGPKWMFLSEMAAEISVPAEAIQQSQPDFQLLDHLLLLAPEQGEQDLATYLQKQVATALGTDREIPLDSNVLDLGMDSLMVVEILNACKRDLQLNLYPREFYERPSIAALASYLLMEAKRIHGAATTQSTAATATPPIIGNWMWGDTSKVDKLVPPSQRNPGIAFLLSSPRSGSTLLRVMLAGHPALFCPPELHLLPFETMAERQQALDNSHLGEGLQRAFMELKQLDADTSKALIQNFTTQNGSIQGIYAELQQLAGPRLVIDKSPTYAGNIHTLNRAEALFEGAKYIHLVRHPYAVIDSFVSNRMDKILGVSETDPYFLAEQVWAQSNHNILEFSRQVGPERCHLIRYEDLVNNPRQIMEPLCEFLEIPFESAMLTPYEGDRMTDGVYAHSLSISDPNFLNHDQIDSTLGEVWQHIQLPQPLQTFAQKIAAELVYSLPTPAVTSAERQNSPQLQTPESKLSELASMPLNSPMQEFDIIVRGLRLRICSWGPETGPVIFCLHGILEHGAAWDGVAGSLANLGYRVIAPDLRGHGHSEHAGVSGSYQLLDYLGDVDAIAQELTTQPFTLVGHSMGSAIAATFASIRAKRVNALILVEPILPAEISEHKITDQLVTHLNYLSAPPKHPVFPDLETIAARIRRPTPLMSDKLALKTAARLSEPYQKGWRWRWDPRLQVRTGLGFSGAAFSRTQYLQLLEQIQAPINLIYGDTSNFNKTEDLALQQAAMPQAKQFTLPGGHNLHVDAADGVARIIADVAAGA